MSKHQSPQWWGPPKNFSERKNERKISWLELFYDLVLCGCHWAKLNTRDCHVSDMANCWLFVFNILHGILVVGKWQRVL